MHDLKYCFKKNGLIICKELNGETVLIDPYRRTLACLNSVAIQIWQMLDGNHSVIFIIEKLKESFSVNEKELQKDVVGFIDDLLKREMIS